MKHVPGKNPYAPRDYGTQHGGQTEDRCGNPCMLFRCCPEIPFPRQHGPHGSAHTSGTEQEAQYRIAGKPRIGMSALAMQCTTRGKEKPQYSRCDTDDAGNPQGAVQLGPGAVDAVFFTHRDTLQCQALRSAL